MAPGGPNVEPARHQRIGSDADETMASPQQEMDPEIIDSTEVPPPNSNGVCEADQPPITKESLAELEPECIRTNPPLRHNINFEEQLQFRPNLDGEMGSVKQAQHAQYWEGLAREIKMWLENNSMPASLPRVRGRKVLQLLATIRDILYSLVPPLDGKAVLDIFDIDLLRQQLVRGSLDFRWLAVWTQKLIKMHCAPMRDQWADEMAAHFKQNASSQTAALFTEGFKSLLSLLEQMKLVSIHMLLSC
jgi:hypothetical protein